MFSSVKQQARTVGAHPLHCSISNLPDKLCVWSQEGCTVYPTIHHAPGHACTLYRGRRQRFQLPSAYCLVRASSWCDKLTLPVACFLHNSSCLGVRIQCEHGARLKAEEAHDEEGACVGALAGHRARLHEAVQVSVRLDAQLPLAPPQLS